LILDLSEFSSWLDKSVERWTESTICLSWWPVGGIWWSTEHRN